MTDTANLALPFIEAAQAQKHVTHNEALRILDTLVQLAVLDRDLAAPPMSPGDGQRWIVAASPTGAWAGHADDIAAWQDGGWQFSTPQPGWVAFVADEGTLRVWNGSAWGDFFSTVTSIQNLALLGVGTTADAINPFSAKLNTALWTAKTVAEGGVGDLRYTLNKESAANVLSLLLQTAFSGRAEFGLIGDDNISLKVSADGSNWLTALGVDRTGGGLTCIRSINGGPLAGLRNMLRNGSFRVWQRGTSFSNPGAGYTADGWIYSKTGSGETTAVSRITNPSLPGRYGLQYLCTTVGTLASPSVQQRLESVTQLGDAASVTVSFKYRSDTAFSNQVRLVQSFGTGGSPSTSINTTTVVNYAATGLTGAPVSTSVTFTVPSIAGMTLGTNGNDYVGLVFFFPTGLATFQLFDVQLEAGASASAFEDYLHRPLAVELANCKRLFERVGGVVANTHLGKGYANSTTHAFVDVEYSEKRSIPTITVTGGGSEFEVQRQGSAVVATTAVTATASHIDPKFCQIDATVASGLTAGEGIGLKAKTTSGYIDISAEL